MKFPSVLLYVINLEEVNAKGRIHSNFQAPHSMLQKKQGETRRMEEANAFWADELS